MSFRAQIRFGTGLAPAHPPASRDEMLDRLAGADQIAAAFPQEGYTPRAERALEFAAARRDRRQGNAQAALSRRLGRQMREDEFRQMALTLARGVASPDGLRERLTWFWADHFTTVRRRVAMRGAITGYVEDAIRPHVAGRFGDLLASAVLHPAMVLYLDQDRSVGPNSHVGLRTGRSLNENLAREVLELHTLGVDAGYSQRDVREMAELLTGIGIRQGRELIFRPGHAEPGAETVFGATYGGARPADLSEIRAALHDLALRPETARHICGKLADYFNSDTPDPGLIDTMAAAWDDTGGAFLPVLHAMLSHRAAWSDAPGRVKRPFHFITSALRALGSPPDQIANASREMINRRLHLPLIAMGQRWQGAAGPDGYFDDDREWIRPQTLAARIGWAMLTASEMPRLPDPRDFVVTALGDTASPDLRRAAARAETRAEGVGIVLAAPEFQRS